MSSSSSKATSYDQARVASLLREFNLTPDPTDSRSYHLTTEKKNSLRRFLYAKLLDELPSKAHLLPHWHHLDAQTVLDTIAKHDYSLSTTQTEESRQMAKAKLKGKQVQRGSSPFGPIDGFNEELEDPDLLGPEYGEERRGMSCGHLFQAGEAIYRCRDCGLDDTCVQCAPCFQASIHVKEGHDIVFSISSASGGCCDCGDQEAWTREIGCRYHSLQTPEVDEQMQVESVGANAETGSSAAAPEASDDSHVPGMQEIEQDVALLAEDLRTPFYNMVSSCLDFMLSVLEHAPEEMSIPTGPDALEAIQRQASLEPSPHAAADASAATPHAHNDSDEEMSQAEGMENEDDEDEDYFSGLEETGSGGAPARSASGTSLAARPSQSKGKARRRAASDTSRGDEGASGSGSGATSTRPRLTSQESRSTASAGPYKRQFALLLWNDEKHSFSQVIDTVTDATMMPEVEARGVAERVDKHGRDIIEISTDMRRLVSPGLIIRSIDLAVTIRPAYDVLVEEIAHVMLSFLVDLSKCSIYTPASNEAFSPQRLDSLKPNAAILKQLIAKILLEAWTPFKPISAGSMRRDFFDSSDLTRFEGLLLMDPKMWKSARIEMKGFFISLIARREIKKEIAKRFAHSYAKVLETFILRDREPEHSICFLTVQLFSVPSIGAMLVEEVHFLHKLFVILQAIFTGQMTVANSQLILPPPPPPRGQISPHLMLLRQSRCYHIFYDVRYLLGSASVQRQIAKDPESHLKYFLPVLSLFHAINPSKRAVSAHVEFESEIWIPVFHVSSHLAKTTKAYGEAFAFARPQQLKVGYAQTAKAILMSCYTLHQNDPDNHPPIKVHAASFGPRAASHQIVEFAVDRQPVSFHHPMHWLLAEMLKQLANVGAEEIRSEVGATKLIDLFQPEVDETGLLIVLDFPLRVCVKLAQIRCNMWVRNGYSIRSQAHHFRDNSMRAIMYDQDLFLIQAGLAAIDPGRMITSMLSRFDLIDWFSGKGVNSHPVYDPTQAVFLAEEFLCLLVTSFSEVASIASWSTERLVRRELIHFMALSQGTYTDVTKNMSEKLCDHPSFERVLSQVSNFRAPDGTNDLGIFELKDECYDEVQPFFFHYSRNQREKAEEVLKARQRKRILCTKPNANVKDEDLPPIVPPKQLDSLERGLFASLKASLLAGSLARVLFFAIENTHIHYTYAPDMLVDAALQLIMIGLTEAEGTFVDKVMLAPIARSEEQTQPETPAALVNGNIVDLLCRVEMEEKFKAFKAKIAWCLEQAAGKSTAANELIARHLTATGRGAASKRPGEGAKLSAEEARKAAAKARQAAIMQKFTAQQKSLLDQFDADDDDDDDDNDDSTRTLEGNAAGAGQAAMDAKAPKKSWGSCILCQENLGLDKAFGILGHVQPSRMMRTTPKQDAAGLQQAFETPLTLDRTGPDGKRLMGTAISNRASGSGGSLRASPAYGCFPQEDHRFGFNASTCGHRMHTHCFETYCRSVEQRHAAQIARNHPEDLSRSEYVCPLCKSLGNVILPVADALPTASGAASTFQTLFPTEADETPLQDWIRKINIDILKHSSQSPAADYQETDHGSGAFLPFFVEHSMSSIHMRAEPNNGIDQSTMNMLYRLVEVLKPLSHSSKGLRERYQQRTILALQSRKMYMPEELVAYTIAMLEIGQRGMSPATSTNELNKPVEEQTVADSLSESTLSLLQSLVHCLRSLSLMYHAKAEGPSVVRRGLLKRLLPHWGGDESVRSPLLLRDPLTILVEAAVATPQSLYQCTALMYYVCLIQTVFGLAQPSIWPQAYGISGVGSGYGSNGGRAFVGLKSPNVSSEDLAEARKIFPDIRWTVANIIGFVGYARGNITLGFDNLDDDTLAKMVCSYTLPFLRRAAILHRVVGLTTKAQSGEPLSAEASPAEGSLGEYRRLLSLLKIPPPSVALPIKADKQTPIAGLVEGWIKHAYAPLASLFRPLPIQPAPLGGGFYGGGSLAVDAGGGGASGGSGRSANLQAFTSSHLHAAEAHPTLLLEHPHIYELARLPTDLAVLLQDTQKRICKNCKKVPAEPALCLFCGEILCYQSFCCQQEDNEERGECNYHTDVCGGAVGVYFKVKSNVIMLLYQGNGTYNFSPYLDSHGEIDIGLRKGRPQKLHMQRYDELRKQVLGHGIANMVARKIEAAMDAGGWQTF
ncbi:E3 ubiquitin-protein ligase ubr1 [Thecaphora frezii]